MTISLLDQNLVDSLLDIINNQELDNESRRRLVHAKTKELLSALAKNRNDFYKDVKHHDPDIEHHIVIKKYRHGIIKITRRNENNNKIYYINISSAIGELSAALTRTLLIISRHAGALSEIMPLVSGVLVLISTLVTLLTLKPNSIEKHKLVNSLVNIFAGLMFTLSYSLTIVKELFPALTSSLFFIPFLGTLANISMLIMEIGTGIYLEKRYYVDRELLLNKSDELLGDNPEWIFKSDELTADQKRFKQALFRNIDDKIMQGKNTEQLVNIFSKEHFNKHIKQNLLLHASSERYKRLARHSINSTIVITVVTSGIVALFIPAAGMFIALGIISFILAALILKVILFNTILKESKISISHCPSNSTYKQEPILDSGQTQKAEKINSSKDTLSCRLYGKHQKPHLERSSIVPENLVPHHGLGG